MSSQNDKDSEETGSNVVEAINGYAWSVGDNPLSFTTPGSRFGSIHRDIARRNIVVAQIDRVLSTYNRAVSMLERIDAKSDGIYEAAKSREGKRLSVELRTSKKAAFRYLKEAQTLLSSVLVRADDASAKVSKAKKEVDKFHTYAMVLSDHVHAAKEETIPVTVFSFEGNCFFLRERSSLSNAFVDRFRRTLLLFADETNDRSAAAAAKTRWTNQGRLIYQW